MKKVDITICQAKDGTYSAYCNDCPALFGMGDTAAAAKKELEETLRLTQEDGPQKAQFYPEWLDDTFEFVTHWDVRTMLSYYSGVITPTALGNLSGIHPKQIWSYMHGYTKPRKTQVHKIEAALHTLGKELINIAFTVVLLLCVGCGEVVEAPEQMELPAVAEVSGLMDTNPSKIIEYKGFTLSYNTRNLIPDWVAYELTAEETRGDATRDGKNFGMDTRFKGKQARREDYKDSGWSRGHMAPAGDFFWSDAAMEETFYLLNICPQDEQLNNKDWQYLEKQVRAWARKYGRVWVVSGPIVGKNRYGKIGESGVTVPDAFFKAVMVRDEGGYECVAFVMQNDAKRYYLEKCAMTIDQLEALTGIDFYPALPDKVEDFVESTYDPAVWGLRQ